MIKIATTLDLPAIAECHIKAFPGSFISKLGKRLVTETLGWYLTSEKKFLLFYEEGGRCMGYCGGFIADGTSPTGSTSGMIQHAFCTAVMSLLSRPWLLFHKEMRRNYMLVWRNILRKVGLVNTTGQSDSGLPTNETRVGLVGIGVLPEAQGRGIGYLLLMEFERTAQQKGYHILNLTVKKTNTKAIKAYVRNGWYITKEKGDSLEMEKRLL